MADYWKSQAKKFCDFCKCWIADNKPSVEFHEKGKRHKENVELRLKEIGQKSRKEYKESLKVDVEMKKMEEAAMQAYLKDIEGEGDFTSQLIKRELQEKQDLIREEKRKKQEMIEAERLIKKEKVDKAEAECSVKQDETNKAGSSTVEVKEEVKKEKFVWHEAKSEEGYTYYWHIDSGEAVWEAPEVGFLSIAEQAVREEEKSQTQTEELERQQKEEKNAKQHEERVKEIRNEEEEQARKAEEKARQAREKMKSRAAKKEKKEIVPFTSVPMGPVTRPDPYGGWKVVEKVDDTPIDLQLPKQNYAEVIVPCIVDSEPKFKIREKTVGSSGLDCGGSADFKKRKLNVSSKRNMRQRLDEDDM